MSDNTKTNETTGSKTPSHVVYQVRDARRPKGVLDPDRSAHGRTKTATDSMSSSNAYRSTAASLSEWPRRRRSNSPAGAGTDARSGFGQRELERLFAELAKRP